MRSTAELIERVKALSEAEQSSVDQFIDYLEQRHKAAMSPFLSAAEDFAKQHPELLRRLAL